jgi:NTP pyrophosphatase (non-canonical NTP hydrolase)
MAYRSIFGDLAVIGDWLDKSAAVDPRVDEVCRVLKLAEECGEAAEAYIGMTGQNPRKGVTRTVDDLTGELADVAVTAMTAIYHFTGSSEYALRRVMRQKCDEILVRAGLRGR